MPSSFDSASSSPGSSFDTSLTDSYIATVLIEASAVVTKVISLTRDFKVEPVAFIGSKEVATTVMVTIVSVTSKCSSRYQLPFPFLRSFDYLTICWWASLFGFIVHFIN